ncbi:hypothetical protein [Nocardia salmonicida]|uniref:hypothetical protein n=1 Tax=Nocardia salmonicida TaxID=53431 RepID=UPI0036251A7C
MEDDSLRPVVIVSADGMPEAIIDADRARKDGLILALQVSAVDNDPAEVERIIAEREGQAHPQYFTRVLREALAILASNILAPMARAVDRLNPTERPRAALSRQRDAAIEMYGRDQ